MLFISLYCCLRTVGGGVLLYFKGGGLKSLLLHCMCGFRTLKHCDSCA